MLIPHLHFSGDCKEAIALYEKAFNTKLEDSEYSEDGKIIRHARMNIHGQTVFMNDNESFADKNGHLVVLFDTAEELLSCYENLMDGDKCIKPFTKTPHSELVGNFTDKFGVLWGFMIT